MRIVRTRVALVIFAITAIFAYSKNSRADESPWSLNLYGASFHENGKQRKTAHQINPGVGLRYDISKHWYVEGAYINRNSVGGTTETIGFGWHTEVAKLNQKPLKLGVQVMHMNYGDPRPGKRDMSGVVPAFTAEYAFTRDVSGLVYLFNKKGKSVLFFGGKMNF